MLQTWHDLLFLHAKVPAEVLQKMIPAELTVEQYGGSGWLGFVPFWMSKIRPRSLPSVPWLSKFHETNIRTYVTHPKYGPGVWFFSLDASRYLGCYVARKQFRLPYFHSLLSSRVSDFEMTYRGSRKAKQRLPEVGVQAASLTQYEISATNEMMWHHAKARSFEFWLLERYRLYSLGLNNEIYTAKVFHEPYKIAGASVSEVKILGLDEQFGKLDFKHARFVKGLNVQCFSPRQI